MLCREGRAVARAPINAELTAMSGLPIRGCRSVAVPSRLFEPNGRGILCLLFKLRARHTIAVVVVRQKWRVLLAASLFMRWKHRLDLLFSGVNRAGFSAYTQSSKKHRARAPRNLWHVRLTFARNGQ